MRILGVVAMIALLLAGPAWAQKPVPRYGETDKDTKSPADIAAEKEAEKAYQRSLGNIPEQKSGNDPWGTVRSDAAPKPAAKASPAKPKAKADSAAKQ